MEFAFTDRHGGVSEPPFSSLNLGFGVGDDAERVATNFARVAGGLGVSADHIVTMRQTHGADVAVIADVPTRPPIVDALVTTTPGIVLCARGADCIPVLFTDEAAGVIGCAHVGRSGLASGVAPATVGRMRDIGADAVLALIGPHVCGGCYEVPATLRDQVGAVVPEAPATTRWGAPALDIGAGVRAQLERAGCEVVDASRCTLEDLDLFSYRREGRRSGRQAGLVRLAGD